MVSTSLSLSVLLIVAVTAVALSEAKKKHHRSDAPTPYEDWDKLEELLKKVEKLTKHSLDPDSDKLDHNTDAEAPVNSFPFGLSPSKTSFSEKNPCENQACSWGKECVLNEHGKPICQCAKRCPDIVNPDPFDKVCSNQNETFDSICHLYRERCLCSHNDEGCSVPRRAKAHLEYLGQCKELDPCTDTLIEQFPNRMADWLFQVMRDLKKRQELHGDDWLQMIEAAESNEHLKHVYPVIWKFCDLDVKPHDSVFSWVTHHELIPITAPVMPMESCIKPFLKTCDVDKDEKITLREWGKCLGLKEEEIQEKC